MRRQGQAALEFLTTYGWALLSVLAVIGVLTYFIGAGDVQKFVPTTCELGSEFICHSNAINERGDVLIELAPSTNAVNISKIQCVYEDGTEVISEYGDFSFEPGEKTVVLACKGPQGLDLDGKIKLTVNIVYQEQQTGSFKHVARGEIVQNIFKGDIEEGITIDQLPD
ncbi:MAG: hypothetical protein ACQESC_02795 [Nanobdellota archaeon]